MLTVVAEITAVMILVRCRYCAAPIGELPQGTEYRNVRCPKGCRQMLCGKA